MPRLRDHSFAYSYGASDDRLNGFYIPALSASVCYDRSAGFFSSHTLAIAAAGVARLIANGGRMRLLVGAQLSKEDVEAIRNGYDLRERVGEVTCNTIPDDAEGALKDRLAALAWMIAHEMLEIKVVLPLGPDGLPLSQTDARDYYHPKTSIFTDSEGDRLMFSGSSNESVSGWMKNYEEFFVFRSWEGHDEFIRQGQARFDRLWEGREEDWIALPVPEAARQRLLRYTPAQAPTRDPLEEPSDESVVPVGPTREEIAERERLIVQYIKDAPHLLGADGLGTATSAVTPWPHQAHIARQVVATFPRRYLIADEVGLGKTISAGLSIRQLYLSGLARRILILTPKSVLRQWQEELYEKFALNVPAYDGSVYVDVHGEVVMPDPANPWNGVEMVLASSHLVRRRERQRTLVAAEPWDLVVVDEAHHARRKDFNDLGQYRPNRLLELLLDLERRTRGLLLLTATPMQVHPIEVWDLLHLLGLSGVWASDGRHYLRFFNELRRGLLAADWGYIFDLVEDETKIDGLDERFTARAQEAVGPVEWSRIADLTTDSKPAKTISTLSAKGQKVAEELARHHTPLRRLVFRNTRDLLRRYIQRGLLKATVPTRDARPVWVPMTDKERDLYERIEEYISDFYRTYEAERKGLGFVMTVYRKRLTSSFYAVRRSLERRLEFLRGMQSAEEQGLLATFDDDDLQDDLTLDLDEELAGVDRSVFQGEIAYVEDFLHDLSMLSHHDSKVEQLLGDLQHFFRERDKVIVFTQYTDTMDFLRDRLREVYGRQVACYSGRGGERWDGIAWVDETKETIKNAFRVGQDIKILLCTEAASEGLNLQTCGVLINYDMPWNPMRVEQRIGRIDRIGQRYEEVQVRNYFYERTVESDVYRALEDRIDWFQNVVGRLQPILGRVGQVIQTVAMTPSKERGNVLRAELERIQEALEEAKSGFDIDEWANEASGNGAVASPVSLPELEAQFLALPSTRRLFHPHPTLERAYQLTLGRGVHTVTFDPSCYDAHPDTVELLTYGNPVLDALCERVLEGTTAKTDKSPVVRMVHDGPPVRVGWYAAGDEQPAPLSRLADLIAQLADPDAGATEDVADAARAQFQRAVEVDEKQRANQVRQQREVRRSAWQARVREVLTKAAYVAIARNQADGLFGGGLPPFVDGAAETNLRRLGYPFAPLLQVAGVTDLRLDPMSGYYQRIQSQGRLPLEGRLQNLRERAAALLQEHADLVDKKVNGARSAGSG